MCKMKAEEILIRFLLKNEPNLVQNVSRVTTVLKMRHSWFLQGHSLDFKVYVNYYTNFFNLKKEMYRQHIFIKAVVNCEKNFHKKISPAK